jgi:hypothetical protein
MGKKTRALYSAILIIIIIALGAWIFLHSTKSPAGTPPAGPVTIDGQMTCLPHRDMNAPHTLECAYGLESTDGKYFALTEDSPTSTISQFQTGTLVEVQGTFAPGEDTTYDTVGSILISSITPQTKGTTATSTSSTSDGIITFSVPHDFALATTPEQILAKAYIPPCDQGFDYCLYYNGTAYTGSNFESAGLTIEKRLDLKTQTACLTTQPAGYSNLHATTTQQTSYSMSVMGPIGDAGAGHYASGQEYRLYTDGSCYQFETRIGETQYGNYPAGSITQFSDAERASLFATLQGILGAITLTRTGATLRLPQ